MEDLLADATAGEPIHGLKWTRKALRNVAKALRRKGFKVSHETVRRLLRQLRYQLRVNRKHLGKRQAGERDQQLRYLARKRRATPVMQPRSLNASVLTRLLDRRQGSMPEG